MTDIPFHVKRIHEASKHADLITLWAMGYPVEYRGRHSDSWRLLEAPGVSHVTWKDDVEYRVRPGKPPSRYILTVIEFEDKGYKGPWNTNYDNLESLMTGHRILALTRPLNNVYIGSQLSWEEGQTTTDAPAVSPIQLPTVQKILDEVEEERKAEEARIARTSMEVPGSLQWPFPTGVKT